ncbi:MAG: alpha/beta hydrolase, partial [Negativicutes bacterium]|nr:alpha/beta hydrolase [Negativicutes bacterium]
GLTVLAPRLSGHGTNEREFARTGWLEWFRSVEDGYFILQSLCREIHVIGSIMGGLLALKLCYEYPVGRAVVIATPVFTDEPWMNTSLVGEFLHSHRRVADNAYIADPLARQYCQSYEKIPRDCMVSLKQLIEHVRVRLPSVQTGVMVVHARQDEIVGVKSAQYIYDALPCPRKALWLVDGAEHHLTLSSRRGQVFERVLDYLLA